LTWQILRLKKKSKEKTQITKKTSSMWVLKQPERFVKLWFGYKKKLKMIKKKTLTLRHGHIGLIRVNLSIPWSESWTPLDSIIFFYLIIL
jgi:hypothetical protein